MVTIRLSSTGKKLLRNASREAVARHFQNLPPSAKNAEWLPSTNRYREQCTNQYHNDFHNKSISHAEMVAYIATSGPGHAIDGWSFLGRAFDSLLRNDIYSAIHFGYYAELRAAMALLATEGIGILNDKHPVIYKSGNTKPLVKGEIWDPKKNNGSGKWEPATLRTHAVVWPCLQHWCGLSRSFSFVDEVIRPAGASISEWLAKLGSPTPVGAIAKKWISIWGVDLSKFDEDHDSRNLVSYRPSVCRPPVTPSTEEILDFVSGLWKCYQPSAYGRFPVLEKYLLRRALTIGQLSFPLLPGALAPIGLFGTTENSWLSFLNASNEPRFLSDANRAVSLEQKYSHFQVLSRATLLLTIATSSARKHLFEAGFKMGDLEHWWDKQGVERGLWEPRTNPEPLDYWADINDVLTDTESWVNENSAVADLSRFRRSRGSSLNYFSALELIGMWGLLP